MQRRTFLGGIAAFLAAPAIIRVAPLMQISVQEPLIVSPVIPALDARTLLTPSDITREALRILHQKLMFVSAHTDDYKTPLPDGPTTIRVRLPAQYTVRVN